MNASQLPEGVPQFCLFGFYFPFIWSFFVNSRWILIFFGGNSILISFRLCVAPESWSKHTRTNSRHVKIGYCWTSRNFTLRTGNSFKYSFTWSQWSLNSRPPIEHALHPLNRLFFNRHFLFFLIFPFCNFFLDNFSLFFLILNLKMQWTVFVKNEICTQKVRLVKTCFKIDVRCGWLLLNNQCPYANFKQLCPTNSSPYWDVLMPWNEDNGLGFGPVCVGVCVFAVCV